MNRKLPPNASVAQADDGAKMHAPAAARNAATLAALLVSHAPQSGSALEIASGTGQHVTAFAAALPGLVWHPTDVDPPRLDSINEHIADAGLKNVQPAQALDATIEGWSATQPSYDLIVLINLLHLISDREAKTLLREAARALKPEGTIIFYGPFKRNGLLTSEGDQRFDADLRAADPLIGYKDDLDITAWLRDAGLVDVTPLDMPANNLAFIARKESL